jgi:Domain of unknown function (DUF5658)
LTLVAADGVIAQQGVVGQQPAAIVSVRRRARVLSAAMGLAVTLGVLNVADLITTRLVLDRGGDEGNPFMEPFAHSLATSVLLKALCLAAVVGLVSRLTPSVRIVRALVFVNVWYAFVVGWNAVVLLRLV